MGNFVYRAVNKLLHPKNFGKRKRDDDEEEVVEDSESSKDLCTPRRKRMLTTTKYIYRSLFEEGNGSDVTIIMQDKTWHLHRLYLQQSNYFSSMFSERWLDSKRPDVEIGIVDENITQDAMTIALGSMYCAEVEFTPHQVVSVLAAATFLQLDDLMASCKAVMLDTINSETVLQYFDAALKYGLDDVSLACFKWMLINFTSGMVKPNLLRKIMPDLMNQLVSHPKLFVVNCEMTLYRALKQWLYLRLHQNDLEHPSEPSVNKMNDFFTERKGCLSLLEGDELAPEVKSVFTHLHLRDLMLVASDARSVLKDRIFSEEQVKKASHSALMHILMVDEKKDLGVKMMQDHEFARECMRFGRVLDNDSIATWRWAGYKYGIDLHFTFDGQNLRLKWNTLSTNRQLVNIQHSRSIVYKLTLVSGKGKKCIIERPINEIMLIHNMEVPLAKVKSGTTFPVMISFHVVIASPLPID